MILFPSLMRFAFILSTLTDGWIFMTPKQLKPGLPWALWHTIGQSPSSLVNLLIVNSSGISFSSTMCRMILCADFWNRGIPVDFAPNWLFLIICFNVAWSLIVISSLVLPISSIMNKCLLTSSTVLLFTSSGWVGRLDIPSPVLLFVSEVSSLGLLALELSDSLFSWSFS
ncbi:unnamed protein product [Meganyctiphanes norvegica]|uniref:Uncharacterized protein n=1 Tax=Meganyctiphanes norvegica TaxID=48144 RepID=A0AAV2SHF3_MEGNR